VIRRFGLGADEVCKYVAKSTVRINVVRTTGPNHDAVDGRIEGWRSQQSSSNMSQQADMWFSLCESSSLESLLVSARD
jgi:hypothetical protein